MQGKRINPSKDINIADRVWIGSRTSVLKGAALERDSILANGAILTTEIKQSNVIVAGIPARIVKENIKWDRNRL